MSEHLFPGEGGYGYGIIETPEDGLVDTSIVMGLEIESLRVTGFHESTLNVLKGCEED